MNVKLFSINLSNSSMEELRDELGKITEVKNELLAKEHYEQIARVRDWEKKVIEAIELKTKGENQPPTNVQIKAGENS